VLPEATARWAAAGLSASDLARLRATSVQVTDLPDGYLGAAALNGTVISLDDDAAGHGWFVDPTPADDSEFTVNTAVGLGAGAISPAAGRMDLLTVLMHELGHVIGQDSRYDGDASDLMYAYLGTGDRRLPGQHAEVSPTSVSIPITSAHRGQPQAVMALWPTTAEAPSADAVPPVQDGSRATVGVVLSHDQHSASVALESIVGLPKALRAKRSGLYVDLLADAVEESDRL
jgi:hypothetical protein